MDTHNGIHWGYPATAGARVGKIQRGNLQNKVIRGYSQHKNMKNQNRELVRSSGGSHTSRTCSHKDTFGTDTFD